MYITFVTGNLKGISLFVYILCIKAWFTYGAEVTSLNCNSTSDMKD
jgi:hypothetical protein